MLTITAVLFVCLLIPAGVLLSCSSGKAEPFLDKDGSVLEGSLSEKVFVPINGVRQGMFIKSMDAANPVLLYLHGGMPDYFLTKSYPTGFEACFTVVWWEQRGSGISFNSSIPPDTMTLEQMISDTLEMTNYLRRRFSQEKIYLMGHSGGTFIGIHAAARAPELYQAYLGVAQMSYQLKSEKLAYDYMLKQFKDKRNRKMVRKFETAPVSMTDSIPDEYLKVRDKAMHSLGIGTMRDMHSVITGIFLPSLLCREYTLREKLNMWLGKSRSGVSILWDKMMVTDLSKQVPGLTFLFISLRVYTITPAPSARQNHILSN
jgi:pimeloyl-ACP methyl ester carboxylesterase